MPVGIGLEGPQRLARDGVGRGERSAVVAEEDETGRSGERATPGGTGAGLRQLPLPLARLKIERVQQPLRFRVDVDALSSTPVRLALFPFHRALRVDRALLEHLNVVQAGRW